jgi:hypothetical protein
VLQRLNNRSLTSVRDDSLASFRTDTTYESDHSSNPTTRGRAAPNQDLAPRCYLSLRTSASGRLFTRATFKRP